MKTTKILSIFTLVVIFIYGCKGLTTGEEKVSIAPANWPEGEFEKFIAMDSRTYPDNPIAIGKNGAVTNTFHAAASRAGLEALEKGGSSVDAALATALTQVSMNSGAVISYFGIISMVHYDASTGEIVSMDANWNSVQNETDPMTIPGMKDPSQGLFGYVEPSGRSALVGGFMKGVEAAHKRYGKLPFESLFDPAIHVAENGLVMTGRMANKFKLRDDVLRRLPETKATYVKPDGNSYVEGDLFKQPALAKTLKLIAEQGSDYMYKGEWAKKAVAAIQADGGKMTLKDLADYEVLWTEPIKVQYGDYELALLGGPGYGSSNLAEALNLAYEAGIPEKGHWSKNAESLRDISDVTNFSVLSFLPKSTLDLVYPGIDLSYESRLKKETSKQLWERFKLGVSLTKYADKDYKGPKHSDTVVVIDKDGNMTAITHSINSAVWGSTGIVVDGISIGDPGAFQQINLAQITPGERLPGPLEIGIVLKDNVPIVPFASMSTGLHQQTVQSLLNIMAFDMNVKEAIDAPAIMLPALDYTNPAQPVSRVRVMEGAFPKEVMDSCVLPVMEIPASDRRYAQGLWVAIYRNPETGELQATSPPYSNGRALAY